MIDGRKKGTGTFCAQHPKGPSRQKVPVPFFRGRQLLRAGTSVGANYREARRGRSKPDFAASAKTARPRTELKKT